MSRCLHIPLLRYVDDYFSAERSECCRHALNCFSRLVRCLLGNSSITERKLECGMPLTVLGLSVTLTMSGAFFVPDRLFFAMRVDPHHVSLLSLQSMAIFVTLISNQIHKYFRSLRVARTTKYLDWSCSPLRSDFRRSATSCATVPCVFFRTTWVQNMPPGEGQLVLLITAALCIHFGNALLSCARHFGYRECPRKTILRTYRHAKVIAYLNI